MLAKIHIAKKDLGLDDGTYRDMLAALFGEESSADLSIGQMEDFLKRFKELGWRGPARRRGKGRYGAASAASQVEALRERARAIAGDLENGEKRLDGLVRKICGVDCLEWSSDVGKLKRLVAILEKVRRTDADV